MYGVFPIKDIVVKYIINPYKTSAKNEQLNKIGKPITKYSMKCRKLFIIVPITGIIFKNCNSSTSIWKENWTTAKINPINIDWKILNFTKDFKFVLLIVAITNKIRPANPHVKYARADKTLSGILGIFDKLWMLLFIILQQNCLFDIIILRKRNR